MIEYARPATQDEVGKLLNPLVFEWFSRNYREFTQPQLGAIENIHKNKNVLVSAPTGTGKTLAAFLDIISDLFEMEERNEPMNGVQAVYVSPLKALINDIEKSLLEPLQGIKQIANARGHSSVSVGIRTGDTPPYEKSKQLRKPPSILCTTPESLSTALASPKFSENLKTVKWVIVDEIHALAESKRGAHLSMSLEMLNRMATFQRIGLSATISPIEDIAEFLVGKGRDCTIVDARFDKRTNIKVVSPVRDLIKSPEREVSRRTYEVLMKYLKNSRTTLIFTNTRSGTERVVANLKGRFPNIFTDDSIGAHHSSVSRDIRLEIEDKLKRGKLRAIVSSTSLELGIDIGYIDQVIQLGSPKSIMRLLQRIGRSGHSIKSASKGVLICSDHDDLVEDTVIAYYAKKRQLDRIKLIKNALDVLAQVIISLSLQKQWNIREAYELITKSYSYNDLKWESYIDMLNYLAGTYHSLEDQRVYAKISIYKNGELADRLDYSDFDAVFGRKSSARMIFYLNQGTIPDETKVRVYEGNKPVGTLEEEFVEKLVPGDRFVLAGRIYQFVKSYRMRVYVKRADDQKPTVPAWFSEELPLSYDAANMVNAFRNNFIGRTSTGILRILNGFPVDQNAKAAIAEYMNYQSEFLKKRGMRNINPGEYIVERYVNDRINIIFHTMIGRKANDALSRAYGYQLSSMIGSSIGILVSDNGFVLSFDLDTEYDALALLKSVNRENISAILDGAIKNTELYRRKFRQIAVRSFMILKNYKGHEISIGKQQFNSDRLVKVIDQVPGFPITREVYREIKEDYMDIDAAIDFLEHVDDGRYRYILLDESKTASPFSFSMLAMGAPDIILMEDRRKMIMKLHKELLEYLQGGQVGNN
ncbi:MAG: ATP-dependent helicase [Nitrososphaerota archaeon]|nr:ATP-dependent helicase [Nitrososphaerota archaeon]MDG6932210.1 ATP-dependent helicase [Nitrososphaerota archaeon]MDG6935797.1 ATP-dependent helicase [Nitrososphaerota archaeon]MDG6944115.1 ATP-dependent helicase [Nitrososphaerota archaeon]